MAENRKKKGRPFLPKDHVKQESVTVRLKPGEKVDLEKAAERAGIKLSEWIRRTLKSAI